MFGIGVPEFILILLVLAAAVLVFRFLSRR